MYRLWVALFLAVCTFNLVGCDSGGDIAPTESGAVATDAQKAEMEAYEKSQKEQMMKNAAGPGGQ